MSLSCRALYSHWLLSVGTAECNKDGGRESRPAFPHTPPAKSRSTATATATEIAGSTRPLIYTDPCSHTFHSKIVFGDRDFGKRPGHDEAKRVNWNIVNVTKAQCPKTRVA